MLVAFSLFSRLRTGRCNGREASHRSIVPSTYLDMGAWKTCCSLIMDPALSGLTVGVLFWWRRSLHRTKFRTLRQGLGVPVWMGT